MPVTGGLFDDAPFEVPLLPEPRQRKGAARGVALDARFQNDYPPEWHRCTECGGTGKTYPPIPPGEEVEMAAGASGEGLDGPPFLLLSSGFKLYPVLPCPCCLGMGSLKARVRLEAGHRCVRCGHPYMPKGDAKMLGVEPSPGRWSPCDDLCTHGGPLRWLAPGSDEWQESNSTIVAPPGAVIEAEWKVLTVHHCDGDKANLAWWNLLALCQRCHLEIQSRVVLERTYVLPHSEWFRPYVAAYYAHAYLGQDLSREQVEARMDELLALELDPSYRA